MLTRNGILEIRQNAIEVLNSAKNQVSKQEAKLEVIDEFLQQFPEGDAGVSDDGQFSNMRLTQAVLKIIEQCDHPQGMDIKEITSLLLEGGFRTKTKNFPIAVFCACSRLKKGAKVESAKKRGRRSFKLKSQVAESTL